MPTLRIHFPETFPGAAKFSGDPALNEPVLLVRAFKEATWVSRPLMDAVAALAPRAGRPRMEGDWILAAIGFVASRLGDILAFHDRASLDLWHECGFDHRPSYSTTHARLTELEDALPEIEAAIGAMIQHFIELDPRIGRHVHVDGTEAGTHSTYTHDCRDDESCAWRRQGESADDVNKRVLGKVTADAAAKRRQQEDAGAVTDEAQEAFLDSERRDHPRASGDGHGHKYRVRTSAHSWLTNDPDAGFRSYKKPNGAVEGWHGYYAFRAVDDFTGLTLFGHVSSSSRTENSQYEQILQGLIRATNPPDACSRLDDPDLTTVEALRNTDVHLPEAILGDKGFGFPFIYEMNTKLGILTVTPWRKFTGGRAEPTDIILTGRDGLPFTVDRHGVIHCKHCGGPTQYVEFRRAKDENPRIYVKCVLPSAPDSPCRKLQSVSCDLDYRMLLPIPRNDERYLALQGRTQFERAHHMGRVRNRNSAKDPILRPKRLGLPWQQLLLDLGTLIDWFRAGLKHGWLARTVSAFKGYSRRVTDKIRAARQRLTGQVAQKSQAIRLQRQTAGLNTSRPQPAPGRPPP